MKKVLFISSEGGHFAELQKIEFNRYDYQIVTEKTASTKVYKEKYKNKIHYLLYGTRKTPIRYFFILLINFFVSLFYFLRYWPDVVITTGTHTAVPMCFIAKMFFKKVIWIETYASINRRTLAGRIVYPIANTFIVQWKSMKKLYPKAKYFGGVF